MKRFLLLLGCTVFTASSAVFAGWFSSGPKFKAGDCLTRSVSSGDGVRSISPSGGPRYYFKILGVAERHYVVKELWANNLDTKYNAWRPAEDREFTELEKEQVKVWSAKGEPGMKTRDSASVKIACEEVPDLDKMKRDLGLD